MTGLFIFVGLVAFLFIVCYPTSPEMKKGEEAAIWEYRKKRMKERLEFGKINLERRKK